MNTGKAHLGALLLGIGVIASGARAQVAPDADAWGEAVDGVQMSLSLATTGPQALPGELPALAVRIRNQGPVAIAMRPEAITFAKIEVDGVWYEQAIAILGIRGVVVNAPGSQSDQEIIRPIGSQMSGMDGGTFRRFELRPGPHRIRIQNVTELSASELRQLAERNGSASALEFARRMAGKDLPALTSNTIAIDTPALSASAERDALAAQTSAGGFEALQAARRLVAKYPDAALPAIEKAITATTDPARRAQFVELAGTIPRDTVIPALLKQVASGTDMVSRVRAAEALLTRGRNEGLWQLMDVWDSMDRDRARADDQARLLEFLVRSGEPRVIEQLGRAAELSADVRFAIVELYMPFGGSKRVLDNGRGAMLSMGVFPNTGQNLPGGVAGAAAAEQFLGVALDDTRTVPMQGEYPGVIFHAPRVCDMAALALARRWPAKYQFTWTVEDADRNRQIAAIKAARSKP